MEVTPSFLRNFSAPIILKTDLVINDYFHILKFDNDGFKKWDAIQKLIDPSYKSQSGGSRSGSSKSYKGKSRKGPRGGAKFGSPKTSGGKGSKQFTFKSKTKKTFSKKKKTFAKKPA